MNKKWIVFATVAAIVLAIVSGIVVYLGRDEQEGNSLVRAHSPVYGNPNATVTIVEFFDPACEACRAFYPIVKSIVSSSSGRVRVVIRYAPLHQGSDIAVRILEAVRLQGKYWEALDRTMAAQPLWVAHDHMRPEVIWELVKDTGVDVQKAKLEVSNASINQLLSRDIADMKALKVSRAPTFFVNGRPLRELDVDQLKALINQELLRCTKLAGDVHEPC